MKLLFSQDDLATLCRPRPVFPVEYHIQNELYGLHLLLREFAGLPVDRPLPWAMEHAINFGSPEPYSADATSPLPIRLAITEQQAEALRGRGGTVYPIGSAFFYMRELFARRYGNEAPVRTGTLVFPDKSTTHQNTDYDRARFADELANLPDEFQPVAVSIFWRDWERGCHEPFARAGLRLVTSGHPYDPLFLFRQYDLCRRFRYACANDLSTSFCLSVLAGCHFFHWPTGGLTVTRGGVSRFYAEEPTFHLPGKRECIAAAPFPPVDNRTVQVELAERFAGRDSLRPPEFFRRLYEESQNTLLSLPVEDQNFNVPAPATRLAGWRGWGIDADGWTRTRFGFTTPAGTRGVRLDLDVSPDAIPPWPLIEVRAGTQILPLSIRPGRISLELPGGCAVEVNGGIEVPLTGGRSRALRVAGLERLERPASTAWVWPGEPSEAQAPVFRDCGPSGWITAGIDTDGWCHATSRASGRVPDGCSAVRLLLDAPPGPRARWFICSSEDTVRVDVDPGVWELDVSAGADGLVDVTIEADHASPVGPGDPRVRAFHIRSASWLHSGALSVRRSASAGAA